MKKILSVALCVLIIQSASVLFSGCSEESNIKAIFKDNSYVSVSLPAYNDETESLLAVKILAVQAHLSAMLKEEKFYRLCEEQAPAKEINAALDACSESWEAADVLSSSAYVMGMSLAQIEKDESYKNILAKKSGVINPFIMKAGAATSTYRMEKFEDAKEWAEYITRIYDHAKVGQKTAYVGKILKTDVQRARKAIEMSQDILKGEHDLNAGYDDATYRLLLKTKTAGKVAGFIGASIASAGGTMGLLAAGGYIAAGVDTAIEVTDTTLTLTLGEDDKVTKSFQNSAAKVAPIISVVSYANVFNPEAWANGGIDAVGQYRYLTDTAVDLAENNKLFGVELPSLSEASGPMKVLTLPVGDEATPEQKQELKDALIDMGYDKDEVESFVNSEPVQEEQNPATEIPFEDLPVETIDEKIEQIPLNDAEWEALFQEVYDDYLEEMKENGYVNEDDYIWDYDPFMPFEDFPQEGDEIGFDDLSMWAKPETPYEDDEPDAPADEEEADEDEEEEEEESPTEEETEAPTQGEDQYLEDFMGSWYNTEIIEDYTIATHLTMQHTGSTVTVSILVNDEDCGSDKCDYTFDGTTLILSYNGSAVSYTLDGGSLVSVSGGDTTVWHR